MLQPKSLEQFIARIGIKRFGDLTFRLLAIERRNMLAGEEICDVSCEEHLGLGLKADSWSPLDCVGEQRWSAETSSITLIRRYVIISDVIGVSSLYKSRV